MEKLAQQLLEDANKRFIDKNELIFACLSTMTEDQLYEMAIQFKFIQTESDPEDFVRVHPDQSTPEKIIEAVLSRYGE